jgi:hypothetical protein
MDERFVQILSLIPRIRGMMVITTANNGSAEMSPRQVCLTTAMTGTRGNKVLIEGWFTVFHLSGNYDIIVAKNWMATNPHTIRSLDKYFAYVTRGVGGVSERGEAVNTLCEHCRSGLTAQHH